MANEWTPMKRKSGGRQHDEVPRNEKINSGEYNAGAYNLDTIREALRLIRVRIQKSIDEYNEINDKIIKTKFVKDLIPQKMPNKYTTTAQWFSNGWIGDTKLENQNPYWGGLRFWSDGSEKDPPFWETGVLDTEMPLVFFNIAKPDGKTPQVVFNYVYRPDEIVKYEIEENGRKVLEVGLLDYKFGIVTFSDNLNDPNVSDTISSYYGSVLQPYGNPPKNVFRGVPYYLKFTSDGTVGTPGIVFVYNIMFDTINSGSISDSTEGLRLADYWGNR